MEKNKFSLDKSHMITIFNLVEKHLPALDRFKLYYRNSKCYIDCFNFLNNLNGSTLFYPVINLDNRLILACSGIGEDTTLNNCTIFCDGFDLFGYSELDQFKYYFGVNEGSSVYEDCNNYGCGDTKSRISDDEDSGSESSDDDNSYSDSCRCGESGYSDTEHEDFYQQKFFGKKVYKNESWVYNKTYEPMFYDIEYSDIFESLYKMIKERKSFVKPSSTSEGSDIANVIFSLNERYYEKDLGIYFG